MSSSNEIVYLIFQFTRYAGTILSTILVYVFMWCWLGIDKDSSTFGSDDASIFRDVTLLTLGVGVFCSFLFHVVRLRGYVMRAPEY